MGKMGRPLKEDKEKKSYRVSVRFNKDQYEKLKLLSSKENSCIADYIRSLIAKEYARQYGWGMMGIVNKEVL